MIKFRLAETKDLKKLAEMEQLVFSEPWSCDDFEFFYKSEDDTILLACNNDDIDNNKELDIIGYIIYRNITPESELLNLCVLPEFRKQGLAQKMFDSAIETLKNKNIVKMFLEVRESNITALNFYKKNNFKKVGTRPNYYHNPSENAFLMLKEF